MSLIDELLEPSKVLSYFQFLYERQKIWFYKEQLKIEAPWTDDEVLHKYSFCNVYRKLDKGTKYLIDYVINDKHLSNTDKIFNIIFYRLFNVHGIFHHTNTLVAEDFNPRNLIAKLDAMRDKGIKIYNPAYLVQCHGINKNEPNEKHIQHAYLLADIAKSLTCKTIDRTAMFKNARSPEAVMNYLTSYKFIGRFLAYEIYCDLSYGNYELIDHSDEDYVAIGPGAIWGLQLMAKVGIEITDATAVKLSYELRDKQIELFKKADLYFMFEDVLPEEIGFLHLRDIEHSLCEYRKYMRLSCGDGRKRFYAHKGNTDDGC